MWWGVEVYRYTLLADFIALCTSIFREQKLVKSIAFGACLFFSICLASASPPSFRVKVLAVPDGARSIPTCSPYVLNNLGEVVGKCETNGFFDDQLYFWSAAGEVSLVRLPSRYANAEPSAINDKSQVVGYARTERGSQTAFLYSRTEGFRRLEYGPKRQSVAAGINNKSQIVGTYWPKLRWNKQAKAVAWSEEAGATELLPDEVHGVTNAFPSDINESGQVLLSVNGGRSGQSAAVLSPDGTFRVIPSFKGDPRIIPHSMNNKGTVVGRTYWPYSHAFIWRGSQATDIGTLGGMGYNLLSIAYSVNDQDQVVGYSADASGRDQAFYYDDQNGMLQMDQLIAVDDPLHGKLAIEGLFPSAINDRGWILAKASRNDNYKWGSRLVLLMPVQ